MKNQSAKNQQTIDSDIARRIINLPEELKLNYFVEINHLLSDNLYWQMLAGIWMNTTVCHPNIEHWKSLFRSKRRNRHKLMKKGDRKTWRKLPEVVTAYRAVNSPEEIETAISWTLDKDIAEKLFNEREVVLKRIHKSSIIAFFDRRREKEIIVIKNG